MKLSARQLCVIHDTLHQSLRFANWGGIYTHESREQVRDAIGEIMNEIKVEILTGTPSPDSISADTGV